MLSYDEVSSGLTGIAFVLSAGIFSIDTVESSYNTDELYSSSSKRDFTVVLFFYFSSSLFIFLSCLTPNK